MSGWSLGITKACPNPNAAYRFIRWACSSKIAIPYTVLGGCTPRSSLNQIEELSSFYPYLEFAEKQFQKSRKRTYPFDEIVEYMMSERDFELLLHDCVRRAIAGEMTPERALQSAVQRVAEYRKVKTNSSKEV
jgi:ABC-type glycerol-3-phosphate transport system substrate-binding protein